MRGFPVAPETALDSFWPKTPLGKLTRPSQAPDQIESLREGKGGEKWRRTGKRLERGWGKSRHRQEDDMTPGGSHLPSQGALVRALFKRGSTQTGVIPFWEAGKVTTSRQLDQRSLIQLSTFFGSKVRSWIHFCDFFKSLVLGCQQLLKFCLDILNLIWEPKKKTKKLGFSYRVSYLQAKA